MRHDGGKHHAKRTTDNRRPIFLSDVSIKYRCHRFCHLRMSLRLGRARSPARVSAAQPECALPDAASAANASRIASTVSPAKQGSSAGCIDEPGEGRRKLHGTIMEFTPPNLSRASLSDRL